MYFAYDQQLASEVGIRLPAGVSRSRTLADVMSLPRDHEGSESKMVAAERRRRVPCALPSTRR